MTRGSLSVMVTKIGDLNLGASTARSLRPFCAPLYGANATPVELAPLFSDKFFLIPFASSAEYIQTLLTLMEQYQINALVPLVEEEIEKIVQNIGLFSDINVAVVGPRTVDTVCLCNDKLLFYQFLKEKKLNYPTFFLVENFKLIEKYACGLGFPERDVVMKPRVGQGSRGVRVITAQRNFGELLVMERPTYFVPISFVTEHLPKHFKEDTLIFSEYLDGEDFSVYGLAEQGEILFMVSMRQDAMIGSVPGVGQLVYHSDIEEYTRAIIKEMNYSGPITIELKLTTRGPVAYEANARFGATQDILLGTGLNLPLCALWQALGQIEKVRDMVNSTSIKWGLKIFRTNSFIYKDDDFFTI